MDDRPLGLVTYPAPILTTPADPFRFGSMSNDDLAERIATMLKIMVENQGIGIAAPQVGWSTRICIIPSAIPGCPPRIMVNPEITFRSRETVKGLEGCLSLPGIEAAVTRPREVEIEYFDPDGQVQQFSATGLVATCAQHEVDHLDGVLFVKRAKGVAAIRAKKALKKLSIARADRPKSAR